MKRSHGLLCGLLMAGWMITGGGCGPDYSRINDELRAQTLQLERDLDQAKGDVADRDATIEQLEKQLDNKMPRVETLSKERLKDLFTTTRVEIQKNSTAWDFDGDRVPDGFRVFIRTYADGDRVPTAGAVKVELFDLADGENSAELKIGEWHFTPEQLKKLWNANLGLNHFALDCRPIANMPKDEATIRATFTDALTGNVFVAQQRILLRKR